MSDEIMKKLDDTIEQRLSEFEYVAFENEEYKTSVESIEKLYKLRIEERKALEELEEKRKARESEEMLKIKELKERKVSRWVEAVLTAGTTAASLVFYAVWMNKGLKFEETGAFTSTTFKGLINRFRPTK